MKRQFTSWTTFWGLYFNNYQFKVNFGKPDKSYCILTLLGNFNLNSEASDSVIVKVLIYCQFGEEKTPSLGLSVLYKTIWNKQYLI